MDIKLKTEYVRTACEDLFGEPKHTFEGKYIEIRCVRAGGGGVKSWRERYSFPINCRAIAESIADGSDYNFYIGRALRDTNDIGSTANVSLITSVSFDFDPVRPKGLPSTEAELQKALLAAHSLQGLLGGRMYSTGNGVQLWVSLASPVDIRGRKQWWQKAHREWERSWIDEVKSAGVVIDPQFDIPRIVKLPGSLSVKGTPSEDRPWRHAKPLGAYDGDPLNPEEILKLGTDEPDRTANLCRENIPHSIPDRFFELLRKGSYPKLNESWRGTRNDIPDTSGSGQDIALAHQLRLHRFLPEEAVAILQGSSGGKSRGDLAYWTHTVEKVYGL